MSEFDSLDFLNEPLEEVSESLEAPKVKKSRGRPKKVLEPVDEDDEEPVPVKPKRQQTDKQKANFVKALEKRRLNCELRKAAKELEKSIKEDEKEAKKAEVERKIVKKATCIKKKEILSQAALDEISDDEIPDSVIEKVIKKQRAKAVPKPKPVEPVELPKSKYNFV